MDENIVPLPGLVSLPVPSPPDDYNPHRGQQTPLVIDNGATTLRWGFATSDVPRTAPNMCARYKERKGNRQMLVFGDAVEVESAAKSQLRTPWEGDVLLNFDALVSIAFC
jgi:actin-related protein 5